MKLIALSVLATAVCAFAFQSNQANAVSTPAVEETAPLSVDDSPSFWNLGTKAYMGGEDGFDERNTKPTYDKLAQAWLQ